MSDLTNLFEAQIKIQTLAYGKDPRDITDPAERVQFIRDMREALEAELQEMIDETGWKPWATSKHVNQDAAQGEMADVLLFFINLCLVLHLSPELLAEKTFEKMQRNLDRQLEGYDGITGKCPKCKRALDDTAVECHEYANDAIYAGYCVTFGDYEKEPNVHG
jgi:NTP pyrophosphatase (non-canonical NTP hydrolase)